MRKIRAEGLRVGDVIMPPAREVQLWMRKPQPFKFKVRPETPWPVL
jgi:hypothetical protein